MNERRTWVGLLIAAAVLVVLAAIGVLSTGGGESRRAASAAPDAGTCAPVALRLRAAEADTPTAPVLIWTVGDVRASIDGKTVKPSLDAPARVTANVEHTLRVEAGREEPLLTRFKVDANTPALLHVQVDDGLGLTLVRLGATCTSCEFPVSEVEIDVAPSRESSFALLRAAAASLRTDRWQSALERLRHVPAKSRDTASYLRLASSVYQAAGRPDRAERLARSIPAARGNELARLLDALTQLRASERDRVYAEQLARWNTLTERFGQLASRFQQAAPGQVAAAAKRLEALGAEFERAVEAKELRSQIAMVAAGEQAVVQAAEEIRSTRPGDCAFQQDIVATLGR